MKKRQQFSSPEELAGYRSEVSQATPLSGAFEKLSQEQLDELQKHVDPSAHDKLITKKINALKDLSTQLQDAGRMETDTIEVNTTTNLEKLQTISEAGEEQLEAVNYLNRSATRCAKSNSQNDTYAQGLRRA